MLWWEAQIAVKESVNSGRAEEVFRNSSNIHVLRHPAGNMIGKYTHHQKFVCIDRSVAYVGGLDLCLGIFFNFLVLFLKRYFFRKI